MKFFFKILLFIFLLFSTSFAKVRVGVFPLDFRAHPNLNYLNTSLTQVILDTLSSPPQIEVFLLREPVNKKDADYFLFLSVLITENKAYLDYRVFKDTPSQPYIFYKEEVKVSEIESMVASLSAKVKDKLYKESEPFWSKINFLKNLKGPSLSFLFKEEKYRVEISVPSPPPPPFYNSSRVVEVVPKLPEVSSFPTEKTADLNSPWQWF